MWGWFRRKTRKDELSVEELYGHIMALEIVIIHLALRTNAGPDLLDDLQKAREFLASDDSISLQNEESFKENMPLTYFGVDSTLEHLGDLLESTGKSAGRNWGPYLAATHWTARFSSHMEPEFEKVSSESFDALAEKHLDSKEHTSAKNPLTEF